MIQKEKKDAYPKRDAGDITDEDISTVDDAIEWLYGKRGESLREEFEKKFKTHRPKNKRVKK